MTARRDRLTEGLRPLRGNKNDDRLVAVRSGVNKIMRKHTHTYVASGLHNFY